MNFIKNISIILISAFIIYYFKLYSVLKGGYLYRKLYGIHFVNDHFVSNTKTRVFFETPLYLVAILVFAVIFKWISNYYKTDKIILLTVVVSPVLFEISGILYDKSCLKPWYDFDTFLWYFPMRLILWVFLYWYFRDLMPLLKSKRNLIIIGCVFLIFHFFKIHSKYNF